MDMTCIICTNNKYNNNNTNKKNIGYGLRHIITALKFLRALFSQNWGTLLAFFSAFNIYFTWSSTLDCMLEEALILKQPCKPLAPLAVRPRS